MICLIIMITNILKLQIQKNSNSKISFFDDNETEIMYMNYLAVKYIWCFNSNNIITITEDMELFELLKFLMNQQYIFNDNQILKSYKEKEK